jgi:type II secretory pathway pseudopilin PulG
VHAAPTPRQGEAGFTYLWLLFAVALAGVAAAAIGERANVARQREQEAELEFRGQAIAHAIAAYWQATPGGARVLPKTLGALVEDRRGPSVVRHLRRVYEDPFTGRADWELVMNEDGGRIRGVHSRSQAQPFNVVGLGSRRVGDAPYRISERDFVFFGDAAAVTSSPASTPSRSPASRLAP